MFFNYISVADPARRLQDGGVRPDRANETPESEDSLDLFLPKTMRMLGVAESLFAHTHELDRDTVECVAAAEGRFMEEIASLADEQRELVSGLLRTVHDDVDQGTPTYVAFGRFLNQMDGGEILPLGVRAKEYISLRTEQMRTFLHELGLREHDEEGIWYDQITERKLHYALPEGTVWLMTEMIKLRELGVSSKRLKVAKEQFGY